MADYKITCNNLRRDDMANLFNILAGINSSDYADQTLASKREIILYAEAMDETIDEGQALRIQKAGVMWRDEQKNGNGEWNRMRQDAISALED